MVPAIRSAQLLQLHCHSVVRVKQKASFKTDPRGGGGGSGTCKNNDFNRVLVKTRFITGFDYLYHKKIRESSDVCTYLIYGMLKRRDKFRIEIYS